MLRGGFGVLAVVMVPVVAVALLLWVLFFGTEQAQASCIGQAVGPVDERAIPTGARVAGFGHDQLVNAEAVVAAASALDLDGAGQALGVQAAIGESSLVDVNHGDNAINPDGTVADSIGLFQQQHWWGTIAERMDPTRSATAFYRRLVRVRGWEQLAPTLAINRVQGNADPYYYARFGGQAAAIVAYLRTLVGAPTASTAGAGMATATQAASADASCVLGGNAQQLAQRLVEDMRAGRLTLLEARYADEIRHVADGTAAPDCGLDVRVLQIITFAVAKFGQVGVSDLNRRCTGSLQGAGTESAHWIHGGGQAVDFYALQGVPLTGGDARTLRLLALLAPLMPPGSRAGQVECRAAVVLANFTQFADTCNHQHIDVAFATGPFLSAAPTPQAAASGDVAGSGEGPGGDTGAAGIVPGVVTDGSDLRSAVRAAGGRPVSVGAGRWTFRDFADGNHGVDLPAGGLVGAGSGHTVIGMTPGSSSHAGRVPTAPYTTNPLDLLSVTGESPTLSGFTLAGTDQGHLYNGLRVGDTTNLHASDIAVTSVPGATNYPPGETFGINDWRTRGSDWSHVTVDGHGVGAAGFGVNNSADITITSSTFTGMAYSAGIAVWQSSDVVLDHDRITGNRSGINLERDTGTITMTAPTFTGNRQRDVQVMTDGPGATITITDPVLDPGQKLRIRVPATYRGHPEGQSKDRIRVIVAGVDATDQLVQWVR